MAALDAKVGDNAAQWQQDAKHFAAQAADLEREFAAEQTANTARIHEVKDRMQQIDDNWHEASSELDRKFQSQTETLDHQFHESQERLASCLS